MTRSQSIPLYLAAIFLFGATAVLSRMESPLEKQNQFLVPPPDHIEYFSFGFPDSMADSFWLRWIQDSSTCETYGSKEVLPKGAENPKDKRFDVPRHKMCDNSWAFKMLDTVTRLAPKFEMPYLAGATALAVLVEDYKGSTVLFNRGVQNFPDDWELSYRAAYHFLFDLHDLPKAAALMNEAADHGAPIWVHSLAARLYSRSGQLELGISSLEAYKKGLKKERLKKLVDERIEKLKAEMREEQRKGP